MVDRILRIVPDGDGEPTSPRPTADIIVGTHLRHLRKERGYTLQQVVEADGFSSIPMLSKYEQAKVPLHEEKVAGLLQFYEVPDDQQGQLLELVREARQSKVWWAGYRDVVPGHAKRLFSVEASAREIRSYEESIVPGLLQTAEYARAVIQAPFRKPFSEQFALEHKKSIQRRQELRRQRQLLLEEADSPFFYALVSENVLNKALGGREVMRGQLRHLYNLAENKPRVHIRILPFAAMSQAAGAPTSITLLKFPPGCGDNLVYLELYNQGGTYVSDTDSVETHMATLDGLWAIAADKEQSMAMLEDYIKKVSGKG
ncbi:hypothetical protein CUT44_13740 [Streptomyces carminius]|uniref:HTH cro/C1-type domain-containing protein n=1 Tax=Streptomyces carminius TaxID=2665496 RepID=A0A2M8LZ34_9ACTN|nr:helix-turn-helix transcriptional regulator [Streptomyces carminius]PJE97227.1 hypothetical protein CUT44_13740 [Streptomyces carminius]